jgi:hypothetical protein
MRPLAAFGGKIAVAILLLSEKQRFALRQAAFYPFAICQRLTV